MSRKWIAWAAASLRPRVVVAIAAFALLITVGTPSRAAPPPAGSEDELLLAPFADAIRQAERDDTFNWRCCEMADGTVVDARISGDHWEIKIRNNRFPDVPKGWILVPEQTVLHRWKNPTGMPIAWFQAGGVRCFAPPKGA